jgi:uncharacterized membrane protein YccC
VSPLPPLLPEWLRAELVRTPGRWRASVAISAASTAALAIAVVLQFGSFPAPLLAFKGLLPNCVSTWRNLLPRLAVIAASALVATYAAGVLVQVPWLLLPVLLVALTVVTYLVPIRDSPIEGYTLVLTLAGVFYTGVFAPREIGSMALSMAVAFSIGITVATAANRLGAGVPPRDELGAALADRFTRIAAQTRAAGARFLATAPAPVGGEPLTLSALPKHLQLLARVRQDLHDPDVERACVALITAAERAALFSSTADAVSRHPAGRTYRDLLRTEIAALLAAIDTGLQRYATLARTPETVVSSDFAPHHRVEAWPDFSALLATLRTRRHGLVLGGDTAAIPVEESIHFNAFVQALEGLADVLRLPPEALEHAPAAHEAPPRRGLPPFDPHAAQFAAKIALACVLALIVGVTSHVRALETCILNPLILAQGSYGATIRKAWLRLAGVIAGGALAVLTVIAVMPNTGDLTIWLLVFFALMVPSVYLALGSPEVSYLGLQIAATYMIVLVANRPVVDVHDALWRFYGTVLGSLILFAVFEIVVPDYAGRQIVSRFDGLLRTLRTLLPQAGAPLPPIERTRALSDQIITGVSDVLRLATEAHYEGAQSGIDRTAAVDAAGVLRRIAHRVALIRRGRRTVERPPLPAPTQAVLSAAEQALADRIERLIRLTSARHHRDRVGSRRHVAACEAAAAVAATPIADFDGPLAALTAAVAALRSGGGLSTWPSTASEALLAEVGHLERIGELLPKLEHQLVCAVLPARDALPVASPAVRAQSPPPWPSLATGEGQGGGAR